FSQMADAPSDAVVLFDGKDTLKWLGSKDPKKNPNGDVLWKVENGYMETTSTGVIRTKDEFGDFQMHLEFATPAEVKGNGQGRGNSGVYLADRYELQVLDSYENKTYFDGQCASIYKQTPPLVNASRKPGEGQPTDLVFEPPR